MVAVVVCLFANCSIKVLNECDYFTSSIMLTGAVMYLFRSDFGCVLYTGDFRWETSSRRTQIARNMLLNALRDEKLDNLYLDNTYCNPSYAFPSREVAARQVHALFLYVSKLVT